MREIKTELSVGSGAGFLIGYHGVKVRIDHQVQIPDQETVSCDDFLNAANNADNGRYTDAFRQDTDLTINVFLAGHNPDDIPEINQSGI